MPVADLARYLMLQTRQLTAALKKQPLDAKRVAGLLASVNTTAKGWRRPFEVCPVLDNGAILQRGDVLVLFHTAGGIPTDLPQGLELSVTEVYVPSSTRPQMHVLLKSRRRPTGAHFFDPYPELGASAKLVAAEQLAQAKALCDAVVSIELAAKPPVTEADIVTRLHALVALLPSLPANPYFHLMDGGRVTLCLPPPCTIEMVPGPVRVLADTIIEEENPGRGGRETRLAKHLPDDKVLLMRAADAAVEPQDLWAVLRARGAKRRQS